MWVLLGLLLLIVGVLGVIYQCVIFVKEILPTNYGNPGFGCLETMVAPWFALGCFGLGVFMHSWKWGVMVFGFGILPFGFLAMLLERRFRD
jgi:hypothetical protein